MPTGLPKIQKRGVSIEKALPWFGRESEQVIGSRVTLPCFRRR
jgi:hypothetical protein